VENEKVGKELLQNGKLKKRVTIIPLNKINAFKMSAQVCFIALSLEIPDVDYPRFQKLSSATKLAPGKVRLALSLVGYPEDVANAMTFVFGDTLVCDDAESAKLVTFSPQVGGVRSVTLEGDVYDPSGTLSGGSAPSGSGTLVKVQELLEAERKVSDAKKRLDELENAEAKGKEGRDRWKKLIRELEIKEHEMSLLEEQVEGSNAARVGGISLRFSPCADFSLDRS
jgi:structural maintenance of chromosome 2